MLSLGVPSDWQREKHKERSIMTTSALSMSNARLLLRELTHRINNEFASVIQTLVIQGGAILGPRCQGGPRGCDGAVA